MGVNGHILGKAPLGAGLTFGFDIGIASVGWAVLSSTRIVDLGVRCFDKAEDEKGESLNLARRTARLLRRRLYRRAWRLTKLARLLKKEGLIDDVKLFAGSVSFAEPDPTDPSGKRRRVTSAWELRKQGLDRLLSPIEWARVIYHLCKHRGFHWLSKAEQAKADGDAKSEGGRVKKGLAHTEALMTEKGYRSVAEMVLSEFPEAQRNKRGDYSKALSRVLLDKEFRKLFDSQRRLGNPYATESLELLVCGSGDKKSGLFWKQKPALAGADLLKMLGRCTFEKTGGADGKGEYRAPKASYTAERHVWLTRLNNLRIVIDGVSRPLNEVERSVVLNLPYLAGENFKYRNLRTALVNKAGLSDSFRFAGLSYPSQSEGEKAKNPEDQVLIKLSAWHELRLAMKAELQDVWQKISVAALDGQPDVLDQIGWILSVYKDDAEVEQELRKLDLPQSEKVIQVLLTIRFDKFHALSLKALQKIVPKMERGLRYDEAVYQIPEYGHHSQLTKPDVGKHLYLPPFYQGRDERGTMVFREDLDVPRNPVVLRALNQARKVMNALIKQYGSPESVHIEMARDLSRSLGERKRISDAQEEFRRRNEQERNKFEILFKRKPSGKDFEKWLLYNEQGGQCAYSRQPLAPSGDCNEIFLEGHTQIDHALPYSRSYDDSKNNKVLVLTRENQNKGNRTAYEYLTSFEGGEEGERWRYFVAWVNQNKAYRMAKRNRLLRKNYGADEAKGFKDRNLNDTRYICKFFKNYIEQNLQLAPRDDGEINQRCVVVSGQLTAFLRARWGLLKIREKSDRHHAMDAAVVAACGHRMVKALADYSRRKELEFLKEGFPDPETGEILNPAAFDRGRLHFPEPWAHFRHELEIRLNTDNLVALRENMQRLGTYSENALRELRPLFVSRAVERRGIPALHEATLRSPKWINEQKSVVRIPLHKLTVDGLSKIVEADGRSKSLVEALHQRLKQYGEDPSKAFSIPFYKPSAPGKIAPIVTTVKVWTTQKTGMKLDGAIADLGEMSGVNVYKINKGFFFDPVYIVSSHLRLNVKPVPESAKFLFKLSKNDLVRVTIGENTHTGYFVMYETDGRLTLRAHDQPKPDKKYFRKSVSAASDIQKLQVNVLGNIYQERMG